MRRKNQKAQQNKIVIQLLDEFVRQKNLNILIYAWLKIKSSLLSNPKKRQKLSQKNQNANGQSQSLHRPNVIRELVYNQTPATVNGFTLFQPSDQLQKQQSKFYQNLQSTDLYMKNQVFQEIVIDRLRGIEYAIKRMKKVNGYQPQVYQQSGIMNSGAQMHQTSNFSHNFHQEYSYLEHPMKNKANHFLENSRTRQISSILLNETISQKSLLGGSSRNVSTKGWKPRFYKGSDIQSLGGHPHLNYNRSRFDYRDRTQELNLSRRFMEYQPAQNTRQRVNQQQETPMTYSFNPNSFSKNKIRSTAALATQQEQQQQKYLARQKNSIASSKFISRK